MKTLVLMLGELAIVGLCGNESSPHASGACSQSALSLWASAFALLLSGGSRNTSQTVEGL